MSSKTARVKAYKGVVGLILVFFTNFCAEVECILKFENKILSELVCIKISVFIPDVKTAAFDSSGYKNS
jgi:hypothetical protein